VKIVLWVVSALAAILFLLVGGFKLALPAEDLAASARGVPVALLRVAGATEVLGAFGLILPAATRILPILTPVAATGLALQMVGAIITNIAVGAYSAIPMAAVLMAVSAWIAWLRFGRYAVEPRSQTGGAAADVA
jgi:uncharacterized membrane protein YphA (DoxX/SURF4 family)